MQLSDILENVDDQDRGATLHLVSPFDGAKTGISFVIAGPDSSLARMSRLRLMDELAELTGPDGRVSAADRETAVIDSLARLIRSWTIMNKGEPVELLQQPVTQLLRVTWVREAVDTFAANRANFRGSL
jgi:hypothetical protein